MTRNELHSILENFAISEEDAQEKLALIWGQPFDGETKKIKPATEESSTTLSESFPDGTTYTDRRDSETPTQPQ
jgi:hypothetical protein